MCVCVCVCVCVYTPHQQQKFLPQQMGKQTMGVPVHSFPYRTDNKLYKLQVTNPSLLDCRATLCICFISLLLIFNPFSQTPQTPMVKPYLYDHFGIDEYPIGTNAIVAVISYTVKLSGEIRQTGEERFFIYLFIYLFIYFERWCVFGHHRVMTWRMP